MRPEAEVQAVWDECASSGRWEASRGLDDADLERWLSWRCWEEIRALSGAPPRGPSRADGILVLGEVARDVYAALAALRVPLVETPRETICERYRLTSHEWVDLAVPALAELEARGLVVRASEGVLIR